MVAEYARKPSVYGITGGIASGKSEVARRFRERGIPAIDADQLGHELLEQDAEVFDCIVEAFGPAVVSNGTIDRGALGTVVFSRPGALEKLNQVVHPLLKRRVAEQCEARRREGHRLAVVDAALIAEDGQLDPCFEGLILVLASRETRLARLVEHRGLSPEKAAQRIDAQTPPEDKLGLADWVVWNEGTLDVLMAEADRIIGEVVGRG